ncbi:MAG: hypothetical protein Q8R37_04435 [Nanoarchaeota archaeon]|nr:hypothetical protein [Nanoarchaeota archaeon]
MAFNRLMEWNHLPEPRRVEDLIEGFYHPVEIVEIGTMAKGDNLFDDKQRRLVYVAGIKENSIYFSTERDFRIRPYTDSIYSYGMDLNFLAAYRTIKKLEE